MPLEPILVWLAIGAVAGWLAGVLMKGYGFGLAGNIVVGVIGALFGGWLFGQLGIVVGSGIVSAVVSALAGAVVLLLFLRVLKQA